MIKKYMMDSYFSLYSTSDIARLFERETRMEVDDVFVRRFIRWLEEQKEPEGKLVLPRDFYIWFICKIHQFSRLEQQG